MQSKILIARSEGRRVEVSEVEEIPEIEKEIIIAIPESVPVKNEPIVTVEHDRKHQETRTQVSVF